MSSSTYRQRLVLQLLNQRQRQQSIPEQGFTLIELLVVIVILGVLGGVGYGAYINQLGRANANTATTTATAVAKNCAALLATGDQAAFKFGVDGTSVQAAGTCTNPTTFTVTAGAGTNSRSAQAGINTDGSVVPGVAGT